MSAHPSVTAIFLHKENMKQLTEAVHASERGEPTYGEQPPVDMVKWTADQTAERQPDTQSVRACLPPSSKDQNDRVRWNAFRNGGQTALDLQAMSDTVPQASKATKELKC